MIKEYENYISKEALLNGVEKMNSFGTRLTGSRDITILFLT